MNFDPQQSPAGPALQSWTVISVPRRFGFEEAQLLVRHLQARQPGAYFIEVMDSELRIHLFLVRDRTQAAAAFQCKVKAMLVEASEDLAKRAHTAPSRVYCKGVAPSG